MGIREYIGANEKTHENGRAIKYVFCEGSHSNKLIVTFPGFAGPSQSPQYNYIRTLKNCNCNRLFILDDYGPRGSYLIGEDRDNSIEESVISLIESICEKHNIKKEDIVVNGTSKGGYCALYYGIKYCFGHVIVGAPQTKLGDYLIHFPEISDYIAGGHEPEDISYLNSLLYDLIEDREYFPDIHIQIGMGDHHYGDHVNPFCTELDKKNVKYNLEIKNYTAHSLTGHYYIEYLLKTLNDIDESMVAPLKPEIENTSIKSSNGHLEISCTSKCDDLNFSMELFQVNKIVLKTNYQNSPKFKYPVSSEGNYYAKIHAKDNSNHRSSITDEIEVKYNETLPGIKEFNRLNSRSSKEKISDSLRYNKISRVSNILNHLISVTGLKKHYLEIKRNSKNRYKFTIKNTKTGEDFAWYVLKNGERIDTIWYKPDPILNYRFKEPGNYQIKYFVRDENSKVMYTSKIIVLSKKDLG